MNNYVIELMEKKQDDISISTISYLGYRNGYVNVSESSPLYGVKDLDIINEMLNLPIKVSYAGNNKTYKDYPLASQEPIWFLGFDLANVKDAPDYDAASTYFPEMKELINEFKTLTKKLTFMKRQQLNILKIF